MPDCAAVRCYGADAMRAEAHRGDLRRQRTDVRPRDPGWAVRFGCRSPHVGHDLNEAGPIVGDPCSDHLTEIGWVLDADRLDTKVSGDVREVRRTELPHFSMLASEFSPVSRCPQWDLLIERVVVIHHDRDGYVPASSGFELR